MCWVVASTTFDAGSGLVVSLAGLALHDNLLRPVRCADPPTAALCKLEYEGEDLYIVKSHPDGIATVWVTRADVRRGHAYNWPIGGVGVVSKALERKGTAPLAHFDTLYHGTPLGNVGPLWATRRLHTTREGGMMGPGVYLGDVQKAFRFAMFDTYYRGEIDRGAVVRCIVDLRGAKVKVLREDGRGEVPCTCARCGRDGWRRRTLLVDHEGMWSRSDDILVVPRIRLSETKYLVWNPETVVRDTRRVRAMDWAEANMRTRGAHYERAFTGHHVKTLPTPRAPIATRGPKRSRSPASETRSSERGRCAAPFRAASARESSRSPPPSSARKRRQASQSPRPSP